MGPTEGDVGSAEKDVSDAKRIAVDDLASVPDAPDPDEDDLDDLDDLLDDFSAVGLEPKNEDGSSGPGRPSPPGGAPESEPTLGDVLSDDEFAKQLQAGMEDLLGEIESSPEMQAQFENIFKEIGAAAAAEANNAAAPTSESSAPGPATSASADASFQETIRRTMERMQASGDQATAAATAEGSDDFMAELLRQMQAGSLGSEGSEEEFSKMLLGMMEQLTNKEILYEPMRELNEKFPDWMQKNKGKISKDDWKRYQEQQALVKEIVEKFEESTYVDSNAADREYIVDRMQKMQAAGSPPADLVGDMPSAQEALNAPDESCNPQ